MAANKFNEGHMAAVFETPNDMLGTEGQTLGTSEWMEIDQDRVNMFADATGDHQWIHVNKEMAEQSPFGTTIAHGFLTLSLWFSTMIYQDRLGSHVRKAQNKKWFVPHRAPDCDGGSADARRRCVKVKTPRRSFVRAIF